MGIVVVALSPSIFCFFLLSLVMPPHVIKTGPAAGVLRKLSQKPRVRKPMSQARLDLIEAKFQAKKDACEGQGEGYEFVNRRCRVKDGYKQLWRNQSAKARRAAAASLRAPRTLKECGRNKYGVELHRYMTEKGRLGPCRMYPPDYNFTKECGFSKSGVRLQKFVNPVTGKLTRCQLHPPGYKATSKQARLDAIEAGFQGKKEACEAQGGHVYVNRRCRVAPGFKQMWRNQSAKARRAAMSQSARKSMNERSRARRAAHRGSLTASRASNAARLNATRGERRKAAKGRTQVNDLSSLFGKMSL
jgi:hypothetical protein